jgi:cytochrome c-type biogenesis protein CcmH/NrfG
MPAPAPGKRDNPLPATANRVVVPQTIVTQVASSTVVAAPGVAPKPDAAVAKLDHLELARQAFNDRDWPRALTEAKAAAASGGGVDAHALVGNTYFKMGRFADAEKAYARAVSLDPKNSLLQDRLRIAHARAEQAGPEK